MGETGSNDAARDGFDPDDLRTHRSAWRRAIEIALAAAADADDRSYWTHELAVFDRTFHGLAGNDEGRVIRRVRVQFDPVSEPLAHPDGPGGWWGHCNPWSRTAVYVPVGELAEALGYAAVPQTWLDHSQKLDAYLLPQPGGEILPGVRYGAEGGEYISPVAVNPEWPSEAVGLIERHRYEPPPAP